MPLPDIALASTDGRSVNLSRLSGLKVIFLYPFTGVPGEPDPPGWDDIPGAHGSTPQAQRFGELYSEFGALGVRVFGLSGQGSAYQQAFRTRVGLPFELLSDAGLRFQQALGLPTFHAGPTRFLTRLTLVVRDGLIVRTFYPVHPPDAHADDVLAWLVREAG